MSDDIDKELVELFQADDIETIYVSEETCNMIMEKLENPQPPNEYLIKAMQRYKELKEKGFIKNEK